MPARFPAMMDETTYAFAVARLRVLETRLIDRQRFDRMLEAADAGEVYRILSETEYSDSMALSTDVFDFETMLVAELKRLYDYVGGFVKEPAVLDALRLRYDFHNTKVFLKERLLDETHHEDALFGIGTASAESLSAGLDAVLAEEPTELAAVFADAITDAADAYERSADPRTIGTVIDRHMFVFGLEMARQSRNEMLLEIWQAWVDLANFKSFARLARSRSDRQAAEEVLVAGGLVKVDDLLALYASDLSAVQALLEFGGVGRYASVVSRGMKEFLDTHNLTLYEKLADNFVLALLKRSRGIALGIEPIIAYLLVKENEIRNLRIILTGKINGLPAEAIRERLRDVYV